MVFINHSTQQMSVKVVYYGPGLCGKTTNLQWIFDHTSPDTRGEMLALATETDRTLFFDLLPIDAGKVGHFSTRVQLYTVPGQVFYNSTRKLVLKGVDGVVFVADSQRTMLDANVESLANLEENLAEMGLELSEVPLVLQFNKRDLSPLLSVDELNSALNRYNWPWVEAAAVQGKGVTETLIKISKVTLRALRARLVKEAPPEDSENAPSTQAAEAPPRQVPSTAPMSASAPAPRQPRQTAPISASAPAPTPDPAPVPQKITRRFEVLMRQRVVAGQPCALRVALNRLPSAPADGMDVAVEALVTAEDFDVEGRHQKLELPGGRDADPVLFKLTPRSKGRKRVKVDLFQSDRYVGGLSVTTEVVAEESATSAAPAGALGVVTLDRSPAPPDLTLLVTEDRKGDYARAYRFTLHAPRHGLTYHSLDEELRLYGSPETWMEGLYGELGSLGLAADPEELSTSLSAIGSDLYEKLFPRQLKKIWRERIRGSLQTIMVVSDELWIPWEIVKPRHTGAEGRTVEDDFLCADFLIARWISGPTPPSSIRVANCALIAPDYTQLPHVRVEARSLTGLGKVDATEPRARAVRHRLSSGGFEVFHFSCRGSFDAGDRSRWSAHLDGEDRWGVHDIDGQLGDFGVRRPFVFLNAYQDPTSPPSRVGVAEWAEKFLGAASGGFLGSTWDVRPELAGRFSAAFYQGLREGRTLGEAMRGARAELHGFPTSTWLAYTLFGDPLARVGLTREDRNQES